MNFNAIIFYTLATVMIAFSLLAVTSPRILRAAVYLLFALAATAGVYFMVNYYFLAAVQLIVYAGGIVVLIIFSILLTSHLNEKMPRPDIFKIVVTVIACVAGCMMTIYIIESHAFVVQPDAGLAANMTTIGKKLLGYGQGGYVLPFEVISILLLAAMVGAIVVAKRNKPGDHA